MAVPVKGIAALFSPGQSVKGCGVVTCGSGSTVMKYCWGVPGHEPPGFVAVALKVIVRGAEVEFCRPVNAGTTAVLPEVWLTPVIPGGTEAVQLKVTPGVAEERFTACELPLKQTVWGVRLKVVIGTGNMVKM